MRPRLTKRRVVRKVRYDLTTLHNGSHYGRLATHGGHTACETAHSSCAKCEKLLFELMHEVKR